MGKRAWSHAPFPRVARTLPPGFPGAPADLTLSFCCRGGRRAPPARGPSSLPRRATSAAGLSPDPALGRAGRRWAGRPGPASLAAPPGRRLCPGAPPPPRNRETEPGCHAELAGALLQEAVGAVRPERGRKGGRGAGRSRRARGRAEGAGRLGKGTPTRAARSPVSGLFARPPRPSRTPSRFQWLLS